MSSWKDISKTSYNLNIAKFTISTPPHKFKISLQAAKLSYNEGDEISNADNPVFNLDFTGIPISTTHSPCGYWYKSYLPGSISYITSSMYPVYVDEGPILLEATLISGNFTRVMIYYSLKETFTLNAELLSGEFRKVLRTYPNAEPETYTLSAAILSGEFRDIHIPYSSFSTGPEVFTLSASIESGDLDTILLTYTYAEPEIFTLNAYIEGGSFDTP